MNEFVLWFIWPVLLGIAAVGAILLSSRLFPPRTVATDEDPSKDIAERTANTIGRGVINVMMLDRRIVQNHGLERDEVLATKIDDLGRSLVHIAQKFENMVGTLAGSIAALNQRIGSYSPQAPVSRPASGGGTFPGRSVIPGGVSPNNPPIRSEKNEIA